MNDQLFVQQTIGKIRFASRYRGRLLKPLLLNPLLEMVSCVSLIDTTPEQSLLATVGEQLARLLDQHFLLTALARYFDKHQKLSEPYSKLMQGLFNSTRNDQVALEQLLGDNRSLRQAIDNEIRCFTATVTLTTERIAKDLSSIYTDFMPVWPSETVEPKGVLHLQMAGQFPFNGGQRIAIITLDNQQKIVYKPRDIRIEARLVGHQASNQPSFIELINNLLSKTLGKDFVPLPTYQFLPCRDTQGHYGYTEYLRCATEADVCLSHDEAKILHQQLGYLTAVSLMLGLYDLVPSNVRISNKLPYLADVDVALDPGVLNTFLKELYDPDSLILPPLSLKRTLLNYFWLHGMHNVKPTSLYVVKQGELIRNPRIKPGKNKLLEVAVENMLIVKGKGSNRNLDKNSTPQNVHTLYADEVKQGFEHVFLALRTQPQAFSQLKVFLDTLAGLPVRYGTYFVLSPILQNIYLEYLHDYPDPEQLSTKIMHEITLSLQDNKKSIRKADLKQEHLQLLQQPVFDSLFNGDYFYITKNLGEGNIYHRNKVFMADVHTTTAGRDMFLRPCSLQIAKKIVGKLCDPTSELAIRKYAEIYGQFIQSLAMPTVPPRYAATKFAEEIGETLASQLGYIP